MARWKKLGIIAGGGALPARLAAASRARNEPFHMIRIAGAADETLVAFGGDECAIGEAGKIIRILKNEKCDGVILAGNVRRPDFKSLKVDWRGAALLPRAIAAAASGDGALLDVIVEAVESEGMIVIGAEEALEDLTAPKGPVGVRSPSAEDLRDIRKAAAVINAVGAFDIGQAAVVANGFVLAVEAAEGTDEMLARCASPSLSEGRDGVGVLVKRPKPGQELRVDLPVIGPETVRNAAAAKLAGIAVEAGMALIIDREELTALADSVGIFVYGFDSTDLAAS